jgi:L-ectoine synthase
VDRGFVRPLRPDNGGPGARAARRGVLATLRGMIVRSLTDIDETDRDVRSKAWRSRRLLVRDDGLGFSLSETTVDAGAELQLWYQNHYEACFCIEGEAEITDLATGAVHRIGAGSVYALDQHDRHTVRVISPLRLVCVFNPALSGRETHDASGGYEAPTD